MAKTKNPLFSLESYGRIGKYLAARRQANSPVLQLLTYPKDARTSEQVSWRTMYQLAVSLWQALSPVERASWETNARPFKMTGYNYFLSQALRPNPGIYLPLAGGTMSGNIDLATNKILNLPAPATDPEPSRKIDLSNAIATEVIDRNAAITTHSGLATGIHGVGSQYVAETSVADLDLAAHKSRHDYKAAYEPPIYRLLSQRAIPFIYKAWTNLNGFNTAHVGSGGFTTGLPFGTLYTGTTNNSVGLVYDSTSFYFAFAAYGYSTGTKISIRQGNTQTIWLGYLAIPGTPSLTQNHIAFYLDTTGKLWASSGNGVTGTQTYTGTTHTSGTKDLFLSIYGNNVGLYYYVNHSLVATHLLASSSYPNYTNCYYTMYNKNSTDGLTRQLFHTPLSIVAQFAY